MTITESDPGVRNGVDTATLFATIDAVRAQPAAAQFQFRATNRWVSGTHSRGYVQGFFGVGAEDMSREEPFVLNADHPTVLVGTDEGPTPVEYVLHALAACLTAGIANIAAARKVTVHRVESTIEGDIDLQGILGLDPDVRNGFRAVRVRFRDRRRCDRRGHRRDRGAGLGPLRRPRHRHQRGPRRRHRRADPDGSRGGMADGRAPSEVTGRSPRLHPIPSKTDSSESPTMPS